MLLYVIKDHFGLHSEMGRKKVKSITKFDLYFFTFRERNTLNLKKLLTLDSVKVLESFLFGL
jgi:hypothetical protein